MPAWPRHARYGTRAGQSNGSFLDSALFERQFAAPLEPYQDRVATMIFEFGTIPRSVFGTAGEFAGRLDGFLASLPGGYRYAIEVRNREYLVPGYFAALARHGVAHVFNAWTRMPDLAEQAELPGSVTADFTVVRALLQAGPELRECRLDASRRIGRSGRRTRLPGRPWSGSPIGRGNRAGRPTCSSTTASRGMRRRPSRPWPRPSSPKGVASSGQRRVAGDTARHRLVIRGDRKGRECPLPSAVRGRYDWSIYRTPCAARAPRARAGPVFFAARVGKVLQYRIARI